MNIEHAEFELHADALLHEMRHGEDDSVVDVVKEAARELRHTLELLLLPKDRHNVRGLRWEIKTGSSFSDRNACELWKVAIF